MAARGFALVTGAARRIGRALALAAAETGFDVLAHTRGAPPPDAHETKNLIEAAGHHCELVSGDLADPIACARLFSPRTQPVSLLVNSASLFDDDRLDTLTPEGFDAHMATNLRAPILLAQAFAVQAPAGALIVNILDQRVWRPTPQYFSYAISKAALWQATVMMAQALAPKIRANGIGPGPTLASVHQRPEDFEAEAAGVPLGRRVTPQEVGEALKYLIDATSVTGQMIAVDGGQHLAWRTPDIIEP
ncbi:MAG TPA: SDR family oxidoreductase [Caulobacteraceae bacterium]|nr:SDR family oxidoreductase [Caulobacteraceae bacterium]